MDQSWNSFFASCKVVYSYMENLSCNGFKEPFCNLYFGTLAVLHFVVFINSCASQDVFQQITHFRNPPQCVHASTLFLIFFFKWLPTLKTHSVSDAHLAFIVHPSSEYSHTACLCGCMSIMGVWVWCSCSDERVKARHHQVNISATLSKWTNSSYTRAHALPLLFLFLTYPCLPHFVIGELLIACKI